MKQRAELVGMPEALIGSEASKLEPSLNEEGTLRSTIVAQETELELLYNATAGAPSCALAIVSYSAHFRVLLQFFLSYAVNVVDPAACHLLVMVSTPAETTDLSRLLSTSHNAARLADIRPSLRIIDFPSALKRLSPLATTALPQAKNVGENGRIYVCAKKAYAVRYTQEVLGAAHTIVTDSEAYVWKPLGLASLFANVLAQPTVWYAHAPALSRAEGRGKAHAPQSAAPISANWCSLHVYSDARRITRKQMDHRLPVQSATFFEYMLFYYPRDAFREYWDAVERTWHKVSRPAPSPHDCSSPPLLQHSPPAFSSSSPPSSPFPAHESSVRAPWSEAVVRRGRGCA